LATEQYRHFTDYSQFLQGKYSKRIAGLILQGLQLRAQLRLMSQIERLREAVCSHISVFLQIRAVEMAVSPAEVVGGIM
jgi:hypothetical protein